MDAASIGKVLVAARIENLGDIYEVRSGSLAAEAVRSVEVSDAVVDTRTTLLSMPKRLIAQLGLDPVRRRRARTSAGVIELQVYGTVRLIVQDRECVSDVSELPDDCPVLIGQVPLEVLDFVVDPCGQQLIGNPAHGGEQMIELY